MGAGEGGTITTGIDELDKLLFGDEYDVGEGRGNRNRGFSPGDVVLIRGEPGTGKTTLALQLAANLHKREPNSVIRYLALEESLEKNRRGGYAFCTDDFLRSIRKIGRRDIERMIDAAVKEKLPKGKLSKLVQTVLNLPAIALSQHYFQAPPEQQLALAHLSSAITDGVLREVFGSIMRSGSSKSNLPLEFPRLFIVDSLGALMNVLTKAFPTEKPRLLFDEFCRFIREDSTVGKATFSGRAAGKKPDEGAMSPVIVIIGEHHFSGSDADRYFPESFFCDVEIVLRPEPIRVPKNSPGTDKITLGYHLAAVIEDDAQHLETRSFCRVVKSRYSRNQSRRCAYDLEPGRGFRFFETFPGDGKLMLFAENEQQRAAWGAFFKRDLTDAYPALRYELFTMAGMETVYESSRRLLQMPLRTDMFLSSLDSYWVLGYRDYRLKTRINDNLCALMLQEWQGTLGAAENADRTLASTWICTEYPRFVNDLVHYSMCALRRTLYKTTADELKHRPVAARSGRRETAEKRLKELDKSIGAVDTQLAEVRLSIIDRHDWLCGQVFGKSADEILKRDDVLPRSDLRETFLRPLPRSRMTLFGQYNADLLPFLAREDMHQFYGGEDHWLCVPYDANVGVFVVREDLLQKLNENKDLPGKYRQAYQTLKRIEGAALRSALELIDLLVGADNASDKQEIEDKLKKRIDDCEKEAASPPGPPSIQSARSLDRLTWDDIICLSKVAELPFGLETRSFDTLMAMFLEMVWNCGGRMEVDGRYRIEGFKDVIVPLIRALHYFRALFAELPTPADQTIDPALCNDQPGGLREYGTFLFGRYWYSALIDALTATKPRRDVAVGGDEKTSARTFVWKGDGSDVGDPPSNAAADGADSPARPRIEIIEMPKGSAKQQGHFTCSGEWSFALLAGSENVSLACDLISNLMGSLKITERGLHGAGLPTVNQFYKRHESEPCVPRTIRSDMDLPQMTFGELATKYLGVSMGKKPEDHRPRPTGIFRQSIFDYRHSAREIFGELLRLASSPPDRAEGELIVKSCVNMLRGIDDLGGRYIFIREPFRQDVATIAVQDFDGREQWAKGRAREPRLQIGGLCDAKLDEVPVTLENLSRGGCCFSEPLAAQTPGAVMVSIGKQRRRGRVVLPEEGKAPDSKTRIAFVPPFPHGEFGALLRQLSKN